MKSKKGSTDTAISDWLMNREWLSQKNFLSDTILIQNVVDDSIAIITHVEHDSAKSAWLISYFHDGHSYVQWASELWSWRIL
jgi:hypothetical protein